MGNAAVFPIMAFFPLDRVLLAIVAGIFVPKQSTSGHVRRHVKAQLNRAKRPNCVEL
jgi:hypothetical protein